MMHSPFMIAGNNLGWGCPYIMEAYLWRMSRKPNPKPDNQEQFKRFIDMAREVETDESPDAIDRAFNKVIRRRTPTPPKKVGEP
jgi:hypothetical protein